MASGDSHKLRKHIYDSIIEFRGKYTEKDARAIAGNIAFLVKYTVGPNFDLDAISIPIFAIRGPNDEKLGRKISVVLHEGPGKFTVIIEKRVGWDDNIVAGLTRKVDKVVNRILEKEGSGGYEPIEDEDLDGERPEHY